MKSGVRRLGLTLRVGRGFAPDDEIARWYDNLPRELQGTPKEHVVRDLLQQHLQAALLSYIRAGASDADRPVERPVAPPAPPVSVVEPARTLPAAAPSPPAPDVQKPAEPGPPAEPHVGRAFQPALLQQAFNTADLLPD